MEATHPLSTPEENALVNDILNQPQLCARVYNQLMRPGTPLYKYAFENMHNHTPILAALRNTAHIYEAQARAAQPALANEKLQNTLPIYLLSYPRSGSNFVQNVLEKSTQLTNASVYAGQQFAPSAALTLKSHAPTPAYFTDEVHRLQPSAETPSPSTKVMVLVRDPRDVLISFYEFVQARKGVRIAQEAFPSTCYYYAAFTDRDAPLARTVAPQALSVGAALKMFINHWWAQPQAQLPFKTHAVKYEDCLANPKATFAAMGEFIGLPFELDEAAISERVSQYSNEADAAPRAQAARWKAQKSEYAPLINWAEENLVSELSLLKYA